MRVNKHTTPASSKTWTATPSVNDQWRGAMRQTKINSKHFLANFLRRQFGTHIVLSTLLVYVILQDTAMNWRRVWNCLRLEVSGSSEMEHRLLYKAEALKYLTNRKKWKGKSLLHVQLKNHDLESIVCVCLGGRRGRPSFPLPLPTPLPATDSNCIAEQKLQVPSRKKMPY